jgi:hypothetical protein
MNKLIYALMFALPVVATSCDRESISYGEDDGRLILNVGINDNVKATTRSLSDEETTELTANCKIRIYDGSNLIRTYQGVESVPAEGLQLVSGNNYSARVTAGDSVEASFDKRYFEGTKKFTIAKGQTTQADVTCTIKNTVVKVNFDAISSQTSSCKMKVGVTKKNMLEFTQETVASSTGYYMLPADSTQLYWEFEAVSASTNETIKRSGSFGANNATLYTLSCSFDATESAATGGGILSLTVDSEPLEKNTSDFTIYQPPTIVGMDSDNNEFSLTSLYGVEVGAGEALSVWFSSACAMTSATMQCDKFSAFGLPTGTMELVDMTTRDKATLESAGITIVTKNAIGSTASGSGSLGLKFSQELMQKLTKEEGSYSILFTVTDQKGSKRSITWNISVSNDKVITAAMADADAWAHKATLRGTVMSETENEVTFQYRKYGESAWNSVKAVVSGKNISADISGLTAGTTYEYRILDGDMTKKTLTFVTEEESQPENASFETWGTGDDKAVLPAANSNSLWWDTGNHGSITMSKNITNSSSEYKHSGSYSAKLESQFVGIGTIGKFAAGNIFVGKYLKTDGTDGILGWGRPFTSRPTKMKFYIRYTPGTVEYSSTDLLPTGQTDQGQVFVAVGDWAGTYESNSKETWPVVIKTKKSELSLFDPNADGVIAYGERTFTEATAGDGMIEVTIDLDYRSQTRKPTNIVIVASASKYGDYFTGGSSTMYIDDIELVYE